jgi:hypothetical protein
MDLISHIKAGGQVKTRDGRPVTIYTTEHPGDYPIVGRVGHEIDVRFWARDTHCSSYGGHPLDLVPVPRKLTHDITVIFYADGTHRECRRENEGAYIDTGAIAIERLTVESVEGRGL